MRRRKRRALDAYCGAGGISRGLQQAGFHVTGVDLHAQPNYIGDTFIKADALDVLADPFFLDGFDLVCASPPCQRKSRMSNCRPGLAETYPDLIAPTRDLLVEWGGPWVIENVDGAGLPGQDDLLGANGLMLCGFMFKLRLYRHRFFQSSFPIPAPHHPRHDIPASKAGHWKPGTIISVEGHCSPIEEARAAMGGVDWMTRDELAESIPPPFAKYLGEAAKAHLQARCAA
jgi:DNA (cytosine-5)-methyltransferase 1